MENKTIEAAKQLNTVDQEAVNNMIMNGPENSSPEEINEVQKMVTAGKAILSDMKDKL